MKNRGETIMMSRKILLTLLIAVLFFASNPLSALELKSDGNDYGKVEGQLKVMNIFDAKSNGYDPETGASFLVKLKYITPSWNNLKAGLGFYNAGDLFNLTEFDSDEKVARGMFVTDDGEEKSLMGEAYIRYQGDKFLIHGGRQLYKTPLTTITYSTMPNFHTLVGVSITAVPDTVFSLSQVLEMSFGSRAMTDFGLIGEGTGTAGAATRPDLIGQADFHKISEITLGDGAESTNGITVFNASYSGLKNVAGFKKIDLSFWDYYADEISNNLYLQADAVYPLKGLKLKLGAQYLLQRDIGDSRAGDLDFNLFGAKVALGGKGWSLFAGYNHSSGDTGFLNAYGGDPAYTSSIFSRNEYRENVDAYKLGFKYKIFKPFTVIASYANYGKSDSLGRIGGVGSGLTAREDAEEFDLIWVYKPAKAWMLKLFTAWRTSEYDGSNGKQLTQAHTRLIGSVSF